MSPQMKRVYHQVLSYWIAKKKMIWLKNCLQIKDQINICLIIYNQISNPSIIFWMEEQVQTQTYKCKISNKVKLVVIKVFTKFLIILIIVLHTWIILPKTFTLYKKQIKNKKIIEFISIQIIKILWT